MHFWWFQDFSEICIFPLENAYFFAFRLAAENAYFIFRWFCPKTKVFMELCIFDGSKIFSRNMELCIFCSQPKSKKICIFPWKNAYFWKILEPSKMHNSMKTLVFGQKQRNMKYAFSAASRKANKYAFSHGKMHISEKSWNPWKNAYFWNMHFPIGAIKNA